MMGNLQKKNIRLYEDNVGEMSAYKKEHFVTSNEMFTNISIKNLDTMIELYDFLKNHNYKEARKFAKEGKLSMDAYGMTSYYQTIEDFGRK